MGAIDPLIESFGLQLFDDGEVLRSPAAASPVAIAREEFGNSADAEGVSWLEREQLPARDLPTSVGLSFYDPDRDYQTGEARALAGDGVISEARHELPAALDASDAKALAERMLARTWSRRDRLTLRLPPKRLAIQPGAIVELPLSPRRWTIEGVTLDGFVAVAELRPSAGAMTSVVADSGRVATNADLLEGPVSLALFDVPALTDAGTDQPMLLLAASQSGGRWRTRPAEISFGAQSMMMSTARSKSVLGVAVNALGAGSANLIDAVNSVEIVLTASEQWLTSGDDAALASGANLAAIGDEVIQFGSAKSLGGGRFLLSRLLRGRGGTECACQNHVAGEAFCLLRQGSFQAVALPAWSIGAEVGATISGSTASRVFHGESVRPLSPVHLRAERSADASLRLSWIRRSRRGVAWIDGVDAPLAEASERYEISIEGSAGSISRSSPVPELVLDASTVSAVGYGPATIQVRQFGDYLPSQPAQLDIVIA